MHNKLLMLCILGILQTVSLKAQEELPEREYFNWQEYDTLTSLHIDSISYNELKGNWIAYRGNFIGEYALGWATNTQPKSLQIKGDRYRKTLSGPFYPFRVERNLLLFFTEKEIPDSAYINHITPRELTLSFRTGENFNQYYYKR